MIELTTPEIIEIWDKYKGHHDLIKQAYKLGYERGRLSHMRETDLELNAVLNILEGQHASQNL